jgi:fructose-bisphosphate aldolase class II
MQQKLTNVYPLKTLLAQAERGGYAVGSFSPRCTPMIAPVLRAGERVRSPLLVQISQRELEWAGVSPLEFGAAFYEQLQALRTTVPVGLHLDHSWDFEIIQQAIEGGFTSVMIDASSKELDENIAISRKVAEYAHARGVSVEAELGRIFSADTMETESDEELYTNPQEAQRFVRETGVDALAVSVGTAHGVYMVRQPRVDLERLKAIRALTPVHLVLHGGSGVPEAMLQAAIHLPGGGVSKVNIATDLEQALLPVLGIEKRIPNAELLRLSPERMARGAEAVQAVVVDKMVNFVGSNNHA